MKLEFDDTDSEFPSVVGEIYFSGYHITNIENCPPARKFAYADNRRDGPAEISVNLSSLCIIEEAEFSCINLLNYNTLYHLQSLSIYNTNSITDVSCFKSIKTLKLSACPNITDVSTLGDVHELRLFYCQGITDVSALGRVYRLDLSNSKNVTDITALDKVHTLNLSYCSQITDVYSLKQVFEFHLAYFQGSALSSLRNIEKLSLFHCPNISDITMLTTLLELRVSKCPGIVHFHGFSNLRILGIGHVNNSQAFKVESGLEVFSNITQLYLSEMDLSERDNALDIPVSTFLVFHHFKNVKDLTLYHCRLNEIPKKTFSSLRSLLLEDCIFVSLVIPLIPCLRELKIYLCDKVTDLEISSDDDEHQNTKKPFSTYVDIFDCRELKQIAIRRAVSRLDVNCCPELQDLILNHRIGSFKAASCPKLNISQADLTFGPPK
jgi:hypothetical protein